MVVAGFAALLGTWKLSKARSWQIAGTLISRVETTRRVVALTLDDGPRPEHLDEVLAVLAERHVHATFFLTGQGMTDFPDATDRISAAGHEIGNHSFSHRRMIFRSTSFYRREVETTDDLIHRWQCGEIYFRPPFGKRLVGLPLYLARTHRVTVMWDVEADADPSGGRDPDRIVRFVLDVTRPGSILLFHVMQDSRAPERAALGPTIDALQKDGYVVGTVSDLRNATIDSSQSAR